MNDYIDSCYYVYVHCIYISLTLHLLFICSDKAMQLLSLLFYISLYKTNS